MTIGMNDATPLERAVAKREHIERELKRCPDFQLYLITESPKERARMQRLLMEIPHFRLWHILSETSERAQELRLCS